MDQVVPLVYAGHVEEGMRLLDAAIEIDASRAPEWSSLGYLYSRRCMHQLALECLQIAVKLDPAKAQFRVNQAAALRAAKNPEGEQIEDALREAIRLDPSSTIGWLRLAVELALRRDHHEAIEAASQGLQVTHARRRPSALACLGVVLHVAGRTAESQAATSRKPRRPGPRHGARERGSTRTCFGTGHSASWGKAVLPRPWRPSPRPGARFLPRWSWTLSPETFCKYSPAAPNCTVLMTSTT